MRLRYTLIFVVDDIDSPTRFLLLRRSREPDRLRWNGVGGKIEPGETPWTARSARSGRKPAPPCGGLRSEGS